MPDQTNVYVGLANAFMRPNVKGNVGVFRRSGSGEWQHVLPAVQTFTVFVHPKDPETVLAGTSDGVWRSTDRGATFTRAGFPQGNTQVWSFLVDSREPNRIFAGCSPIALYRSDDKGATWRALPLPAIPEHCKGPFANRVMRLAQHPRRGDEIYAACEINGVMRSGDLGETWTDCSAGLIELSKQPHLSSKIVGDTTAEGMLDVHAVTINPADPDNVVLALRMGLFRSSDQGKIWQDMEVGRFSPTTYGRDIRTSTAEPNTIYSALSVSAASHAGGVYRSEDGGQSWKRFDKVEVHGTIMSVGLHASDPAQVYLGARYDGEVFGTRDAGKTWEAMPLPGEVQDIYSVACG
jgi:photosystem II stability/assembly factor-like uncharacterized protein